jgi:hypothetical protein
MPNTKEGFMRVRFVLLLVGLLGLLAVSLAPPSSSHNGVVASARGAYHWTIPASDVFGIEIRNQMWFKARRSADGTATGHFLYIQQVAGETFAFAIDVTCLGTPAANRAKVGGIVTYSNDPTIPVGQYGWFQVYDNGRAAPDTSSLVGFGDEAANEAFCASPNPPRFGPWEVQGSIKVRG